MASPPAGTPPGPSPESDDPRRIVRATAELARLEITDEEADRLAPQFARILEAFRELASLDVEGVDGVARMGGTASVVRPDEERPSLPADAVLDAAPERIDDFFGVPKTVERPGSSGGPGGAR